MQHGHEMHASSDIVDHHHHYASSTANSNNAYHFHIPSYLNQSEPSSQRFPPTPDAFRTHDRHEAEHVYNSLPPTLDPSVLSLHSDYNQVQPVTSSIGPNGSNSTTPTGSLRLHAYNPHDLSSSSKRRDTLGHLQIHIPPEQEASPPLPDHLQGDAHLKHQPSDMHGINMHTSDMHMHLGESHGQDIMSGIGQEHSQHNDGAHAHNVGRSHWRMSFSLSNMLKQIYPLLDHHQSSFFMPSEAFANSPTNASTPSDASPHSELQAISPPSAMPSSSPPSILGRPFRSSSLSMGMSNASRPIQLIPPPSPLSPTHIHPPTLSTHPHMFPTPYFSSSNNPASPGYPPTPATSHHTQGSSSSSHSSSHTRYSFRGSPVPHFTPRGHSRSNSYGTLSTISVRSSSPASSVTSGLTSLSGGPGSAPASIAGPTGSPMHFGESSDVQMTYADGSSPPNLTSPGLHPRSQSHPPHSLSPTTHTTFSYSALMQNSRRPTQSGGSFSLSNGNPMMDVPSEPPPHPWHRPEDFVPISSTTQPRLTDEGFQSHYGPKPLSSRAPHRKQKLANSDRKAICLYARQHPSARQEDIAARYNVERSTISKILKNKERWLGCPDDDAKVARKRYAPILFRLGDDVDFLIGNQGLMTWNWCLNNGSKTLVRKRSSYRTHLYGPSSVYIIKSPLTLRIFSAQRLRKKLEDWVF